METKLVTLENLRQFKELLDEENQNQTGEIDFSIYIELWLDRPNTIEIFWHDESVSSWNDLKKFLASITNKQVYTYINHSFDQSSVSILPLCQFEDVPENNECYVTLETSYGEIPIIFHQQEADENGREYNVEINYRSLIFNNSTVKLVELNLDNPSYFEYSANEYFLDSTYENCLNFFNSYNDWQFLTLNIHKRGKQTPILFVEQAAFSVAENNDENQTILINLATSHGIIMVDISFEQDPESDKVSMIANVDYSATDFMLENSSEVNLDQLGLKEVRVIFDGAFDDVDYWASNYKKLIGADESTLTISWGNYDGDGCDVSIEGGDYIGPDVEEDAPTVQYISSSHNIKLTNLQNWAGPIIITLSPTRE